MVTFQTAEVYNEDQDNIIGVKVKVSADNGQVIDEIQVTNKTELDELKAELDSLGDDYVKFDEDSQLAGLTVEEILENISQTININATQLNGIQSDGYAKTAHTHLKSSITDLYTYSIGLSNYNVGVGNNVTVSVNVINQAGSPVSGHQVILYKDGDVWKTGTTNNSGIYSTTFSATEEGLVTFGVNNQKVQCNVKYDTGWVNLTPGSGASGLFTNYDTDRPLQIRRVGKMVKIRGALRTTRVINVVGQEGGTEPWYVCNLPGQFAPSKDELSIQQASSFNKHMMKIKASDKALLVAGRYGTTTTVNIPKDAYLACYMTYFVD